MDGRATTSTFIVFILSTAVLLQFSVIQSPQSGLLLLYNTSSAQVLNDSTQRSSSVGSLKDVREGVNYTLEIAKSINKTGWLYMQKEQYEEAISYFERALKINDNGDMNLSSLIHENLAIAYYQSGEYFSAQFHAQRTLALSQKFNNLGRMKIGYELLTEIYKELGEFEQALESQKKLAEIEKSLLKAEKTEEQGAMLWYGIPAGFLVVLLIGSLYYGLKRFRSKPVEKEPAPKVTHNQQVKQNVVINDNKRITNVLQMARQSRSREEQEEDETEIDRKKPEKIPPKPQSWMALIQNDPGEKADRE